MKNLKKHSVIGFLLFMFLLTSCSKEQQALNKLEGKWRYTSASVLGFAVDLNQIGFSNSTLEFNKCDSKKTQACTGVINLGGTSPVAFVYDMASDGKSVTVLQTGGTSQIYNIVKLDKNNLVYSTPAFDTIIAGQNVKVDVEFTCER